MRPVRIFKIKAAAPISVLAAFLFFIDPTFAQIIIEEEQWAGTAAYYERAIASGTPEVKRDVLHRIRGHRSAEASNLAMPALRDADPIVRATAASAVIWLEPVSATQALLPLLGDRSEFVRREAAYALATAGTNAAVPRLSEVLRRDSDNEVRAAAAIALGRIGDPAAVGPLLQTVRGRRNEETEFLRSMAARSIGQIALFVRGGIRPETVPQNFLPLKHKLTTALAPSSVSAPIFGKAVAELRSILLDDREAMDVRRHAAFAIGAIGEEGARSLLERFTTNSDPYLSEIAREALLMLSETSDEN